MSKWIERPAVKTGTNYLGRTSSTQPTTCINMTAKEELSVYVKRETAQNKCNNKVPKLLLSEIKVVFSLIRPGNRLRSGHFLKTS